MKKFLLDEDTFDYLVRVISQCSRPSSFEISDALFDFDTDDARLSHMEEVPAVFSAVRREADNTISATFITTLKSGVHEQIVAKITIGRFFKFGVSEAYCLKTLSDSLTGASLTWVAEDVAENVTVNNVAQTN